MRKYPKSSVNWKPLAKGVLVIELLAVGGFYYVWRKMNRERGE
jgi:hypothetical protein